MKAFGFILIIIGCLITVPPLVMVPIQLLSWTGLIAIPIAGAVIVVLGFCMFLPEQELFDSHEDDKVTEEVKEDALHLFVSDYCQYLKRAAQNKRRLFKAVGSSVFVAGSSMLVAPFVFELKQGVPIYVFSFGVILLGSGLYLLPD